MLFKLIAGASQYLSNRDASLERFINAEEASIKGICRRGPGPLTRGPRGRLSAGATGDALAFEQPREILAAGNDAGVGRVERVHEDREGAAVERFGLG